MFCNAFALRPIRLHELDAIVDKFVLEEATRMYSEPPKPLYYTENRERCAA